MSVLCLQLVSAAPNYPKKSINEDLREHFWGKDEDTAAESELE